MKTLLICLSFLIMGCSSKLPKVEKVEVPVWSCPKPVIPAKPDLEIYHLSETSTTKDTLRAYGRSLDLLLIENESLRHQLQQYNQEIK